MKKIILIVLGTLSVICYAQQKTDWESLALPDTVNDWILPSQNGPSMPIWGNSKGISVGLAPLPGPRGLLRIYAPYLNMDVPRMLNYIAFEPIPFDSNVRGFSELEMSSLDNVRGKRFWSSNDSLGTAPCDPALPARGTISNIEGQEVLTVYIYSEEFKNGSKVYVRLRFFKNNPYEVELTTYNTNDSKKMKEFILTATMGNLPRLRVLYLKDGEKTSLETWPDYHDFAFAKHEVIPKSNMLHDEIGNAYFVAAPNESYTKPVNFSADTHEHWKYSGKFATQYWISENPLPDLQGLVNGRVVYWASKSPIPGGISFENFELKAPFRNGGKFIFGLDPGEPDVFIKERKIQ
jgi:hypothetical protein